LHEFDVGMVDEADDTQSAVRHGLLQLRHAVKSNYRCREKSIAQGERDRVFVCGPEPLHALDIN
jgi:hypothetical protein